MIASLPCSCYLLACLTWHFWRLCGHYPKFVWPADATSTLQLTRPQFDALVLGLPWQRLGDAGIIRVI